MTTPLSVSRSRGSRSVANRFKAQPVFLLMILLAALIAAGGVRSSAERDATADIERGATGVRTSLRIRSAKALSNAPFAGQAQTGCCDGDEGEQKPHLLAGSYYKVTDGFSARLLLNNKGPVPIDVQPTLFSLNGQRFDLPTVTAEANNHRFIDFRDWVALAGPQFSEGSIQVFHRGKDLVLGVQIYLTDEIHSLSFEEKLIELGQGSTRLEGVWWLPSPKGEVSLVVSNTSDASLCAVTKIQGESPRKEASLAIELAPHETRVVNINTGILQREHGAMSQFGSISIEHNGAAGAVLARAMAFENIAGYSLPVQFSNPAGAKSNNLQGAGLRLSDVRGDRLSAKVVLHNASAADMLVNGRVPYATTDGVTGELYLPQQQLSVGETQVMDVSQLLTIQGVQPHSVSSAGLELQHTGDVGALITSSFSVSENGSQVFRMPIWDVAAQRSATGGYPWYIDGDSSTVVYIKNTTDQQRQFRLYLMYEGGAYLYPLTAVAPHQTQTIDIRALRDDQVPDANGETIPLATNRGQVQWSLTGGEDRVFIGRSEQADLVKRISSNYSCINCCGNSFYDGWLTPGSTVGFAGDEMQLTAMQQDMNCYGQPFSPYPAWAVFDAANSSICDAEPFGSTILVTAGQTSIYGDWNADSWSSGIGGYCEYTPMKILRDALCEVFGNQVSFLFAVSDPEFADFFNNSATLRVSCVGERFVVRVKFKLPDDSASCCSDNRTYVKLSDDNKFEYAASLTEGWTWKFFPDATPNPYVDIGLRRRPDNVGTSNRVIINVFGFRQNGQSYSGSGVLHLGCS